MTTAFDFRKKILHSFAAGMVRQFIMGLAGILVARLLGPEGKGYYSLVTLLNGLAISVLDNGLGMAQLHLKKQHSVEKLLVNVLLLAFFLGIAAVILMTGVAFLLRDSVLDGIEFWWVIGCLCLVPLQVAQGALNRVFQSQYDIQTYNITLLVRPVLLLSLFAAIWLGSAATIALALWAWVAASLMTFVLLVFLVRRRIKVRLRDIDATVIRQILSYASKVGLGGLLGFMQYRVDVFVVGYLMNATAVGIYTVALTSAELLWKVPQAISSVLLPKIVDSSDEEANRLTPMVCRQSTIILLVLGGGMFLFTDPFVLFLFGEDYRGSASALRFLIPGIAFSSLWKIMTNDLIARGHPLFYTYTVGLAASTMVLLDFLLVPKMGVDGAAIASSIAYSFSYLAMLIAFTRITGVPGGSFVPGRTDLRLLYRKNLDLAKSVLSRA